MNEEARAAVEWLERDYDITTEIVYRSRTDDGLEYFRAYGFPHDVQRPMFRLKGDG